MTALDNTDDPQQILRLTLDAVVALVPCCQAFAYEWEEVDGIARLRASACTDSQFLNDYFARFRAIDPLSAEAEASLDRFAKRAGLLFQVVDDILDCTASTATLGKTAGKDQAAEKPTYVSLLGLEGAREFADSLRTQALDSLALFGERAQRLISITDFITHRKF